ncbi:prolyl oligopeptidase family serine peptidase [Xanthobacteraceae bacterium A53D]
MTAITYPHTRRDAVAEDHFGVRVADPYRWLETDVRNDPQVAGWVAEQNALTSRHLEDLPGREAFRTRLRLLFDHEQVSLPRRRGTRYFHQRNPGLDNQPRLLVREGVDGTDRVVIDPNLWSQDGATALAEWAPSEDGTLLAHAVQDGGTDWRTIRVLEVDTGRMRDDEVRWARFCSIFWTKDGSGFFYSRFPEPAAGGTFQAGVSGHAVYFHRLGTPQADDRLIHATPDHPHLLNMANLTRDGRYAAIVSTPGAGHNALAVVDLSQADWTARSIVADFDNAWALLGNLDTTLVLYTDRGAERGKIVTLDLSAPEPTFRDLIPEQAGVLQSASLVGGRLIASYAVDAQIEVRRFHLDGTPDGDIALPGIGTAGGFGGEIGNPETFFVFTSFNAPTTIYRYDVEAGAQQVWAAPHVAVDPATISVTQHFCTSRDGTRVPMFVVRHRDVTGPAPTLLYAYGGFSISLLPYYSPDQLAWIDQGGVLVVANLRGGSEYGRAWHDAGRRANKQNVFDDFIAAAEYLKAEGITSPDGLAIKGESNGGLLVGAVVNQRPDLFAAAFPGVGVMDMLRFNLFTGGSFWMSEYGDPARADDFRTLLAYSPLHTIRPDQDYPAILATTADTDDRVVPSHTFKYVAALQAANLGTKPHLVRIETRAGHGAGKPTDKVIDEVADMWSFAARWTGLHVTGR